MPAAPFKHFSLARRRFGKRVTAAGLSLLLPACRPTEEPGSSQTAKDPGAGALRLDLRQRRINGADDFTLEGLRFEPAWRGRQRPADGLGWGDYRFSVYGPDRDTLLFRQGFDTDVDPAARSATTRVSVRCSMPRHPVRAAIERRSGESAFDEVASVAVDPASSDIDRSPVVAARVDTLFANGDPEAKADLAILGDGYRETEYAKFLADAARAAGYLFSVEPFSKRRGDFNVYSVFAPSADSGVTDAYLGLTKSTVFRCAYFGGGAERTLAERNHTAVREVASVVPYDFLLILANARRYGGSAYLGGPAVVAIDSAAARYLVIHEFAHVIGGLADEYYIPAAGGPAYTGSVEPWYPNVTIAPDRGKWRALLSEPRLAPNRWNKAEYERYFTDYARRYEALRAAGAEETAVEKFMEREAARQAALLAKNGARQAGFFEGANGYARGMFRAEADCIMFSLQTDRFCGACAAAIERMIDYHSR